MLRRIVLGVFIVVALIAAVIFFPRPAATRNAASHEGQSESPKPRVPEPDRPKELLGVSVLALKGPYVWTRRNQDGSLEECSRRADEEILTRKLLDSDRSLLTTTVYRLSREGSLLTSEIYDGAGVRLFKSRYGYGARQDHPSFGRLLEEQMFDARTVHRKKGSNEEQPSWRFIYTCDADGNSTQPISIRVAPLK